MSTTELQTPEQAAWLKGWHAGKQAYFLNPDGGDKFLVDTDRNLIWGPFESDEDALAAKVKMTGEGGYLWALSNLQVFDPAGLVDFSFNEREERNV